MYGLNSVQQVLVTADSGRYGLITPADRLSQHSTRVASCSTCFSRHAVFTTTACCALLDAGKLTALPSPPQPPPPRATSRPSRRRRRRRVARVSLTTSVAGARRSPASHLSVSASRRGQTRLAAAADAAAGPVD